MSYTDAVKNAQADEDAARIPYVSMHTDNPGSTGANEATGGSYARKDPTWAPAGTEGPLGASDQPATVGVAWGVATFELAAGTYPYFGGWSAVTGGTFIGGDAFNAEVVLAADGTEQVSFFVSAEDAA